jgi:hypothetical protein
MNLEQAKERLLVPELMQSLGVRDASIPVNGCGHAKCPWPENHTHGDNKPSFSIYAEGQRAHCFACNFDGDAPSFMSRWLGISNADACRRFIRMAEGADAGFSNSHQPRSHFRSSVPSGRPVRQLTLPSEVSDLSAEQINQVAAIRGLDLEAIQYAATLQVLKYARVCGEPCWMLVDNSQRIAEARRLDGKFFPAMGNLSERKAHTIKGSNKSWPLGAALLNEHLDVNTVLLVEGGPDFLAALHFILRWKRLDILPIAMLGSGAGKNEIHVAAKRQLAGKKVCIYPHNDPNSAGLSAAINWSRQLLSIGCELEITRLASFSINNGAPLKDLNDLATQTMSVHPQS